MADGALPVKGLDDFMERTICFDNSAARMNFCGPYDKTLSELEADLGVVLIATPEGLTVQAPSQDIDHVYEVLKGLAEQASQGNLVSRSMARTPTGEVGISFKTRKKQIEPRTDTQKKFAKNLLSNELNFGIGPAGTGKTYLAVAAGVHLFIEGDVDKIILSRPAVEAGERLGFLPGAMEEKVDPYMQPLYDALNDFFPAKQLSKLKEEKKIEIAPLAFMRGRTLSNAFVVLDEAQNATSMQMKMFLTRLGEGSRMVVTGDPGQVDLPRGVTSGLAEAVDLLGDLQGIGVARFSAEDVVRHPLVAKIIKAYGEG